MSFISLFLKDVFACWAKCEYVCRACLFAWLFGIGVLHAMYVREKNIHCKVFYTWTNHHDLKKNVFEKKKRIHNFSGCYFWLTFRPFLHHEYISLILNNSQHYHNKTFIRDRLGHGGSDVEWRLWWWWWWCRRRWPRPRCTLTSNSRGSFSRARSRSSKR